MQLSYFVERIQQARYVTGGRNYENVDCYGIVWLYWRDLRGLILSNWSSDYEDVYSVDAARCFLKGIDEFQPVDTPQEGDAVLYRNGKVYHCGLVLDSKYFIHIEENINVHVERLDTLNLMGKRLGFYRPLQNA